MKKLGRILEPIGATLVALFLCALLFPILLAILLGALIYTPIDYVKFKTSRHRKDFPCKYRWLSGEHADGRVYTVIKEENLPIDYLRPESFDPEFHGFFLCGNTLMVFSHPLFFEEKSGTWLLWAKDDDKPTEADEDAASDESPYAGKEENYDDCLQIPEACEFFAEFFREHFPDRACDRVVFFYERERVTKSHGKHALEILECTDGFVVYSKRHLRDAIVDYLKEQPKRTGEETT